MKTVRPYSSLLVIASDDDLLSNSGPESQNLESLGKKLSTSDVIVDPRVRFVFIDATWIQARKMVRNERFHKLKQIRLESKKTMFWRYQTGQADDHLATIEVNDPPPPPM